MELEQFGTSFNILYDPGTFKKSRNFLENSGTSR